MKVMFKATVRGLFILNTMYCFDAYNWFNSSRSLTPKHQNSYHVDEFIKVIKRPYPRRPPERKKDKEIFN